MTRITNDDNTTPVNVAVMLDNITSAAAAARCLQSTRSTMMVSTIRINYNASTDNVLQCLQVCRVIDTNNALTMNEPRREFGE